MQYIVKCKDGRRWKVREAVSLNAACNAIDMARVSGSIGHSDHQITHVPGRPYNEWPSKVIASVIELNSDGTECQAYTQRY